MQVVRHPQESNALAAAQAGLISAAQCEALGITADRRARLVRDGLWARVARSVYATGIQPPCGPDAADVWRFRQLRQVWAALLAGGPESIAVGLGALALHGVWGVPGRVPLEVALPDGAFRRGRAQMRVRRFDFPDQVVMVDGVRSASVAMALVHALPEVGRDLAVVLLDSALNRGLLDADGMAVVRDRVRGRRGAARLHQVWPLVDARAESPLETRARLDCVDHRLSPSTLQLVIRSSNGAFLGRADLGWRRRDGGWVAAELDGVDVHDEPSALFHDRRRHNDILGAGVTLLRFTSDDVRRRGSIAHAVRALL